MPVSQIGNGDFPLNNCAILRQLLEPEQLDFIQTFLRGDALINPIQELSAGVKGAIGDAIANISSLPAAGLNQDGTPALGYSQSVLDNWTDTLNNFSSNLTDFESYTNRMSGVITGFQEGEPDLGRILGIGSAYNSALATLATDPAQLLEDNFSHGFNSLKKEFGIDAMNESNNVLDQINNLLAQAGTGYPGDIPAADFVNQMQQLTGSVDTIWQSITNIRNAENAFLAGALAFLDKFGLANTALSGVLTDPCMIGKVIKDLIASPDLSSLIPSLELPSLPSLDEIASLIPDPESIAEEIKASVEGIVESIQQQVEQLIDDAAAAGQQVVEQIQQGAEDLIAAGENLIAAAEQAAEDLAENVEEFGKDVEQFFEDLEAQSEEGQEDVEEEEETPVALPATVSPDLEELIVPPTAPQTRADEVRYASNTVVILYRQELRKGIVGGSDVWLANNFSLRELEEAHAYADYQSLVDRDYNALGPDRSLILDAIQIKKEDESLFAELDAFEREQEEQQAAREEALERARLAEEQIEAEREQLDRSRPSWLAELGVNHKHSITIKDPDGQPGSHPGWRIRINDDRRNVLIVGAEYFDTREKAIEAATKVQNYSSEILGRQLSGNIDRTQVKMLLRGQAEIENIFPTEITKLEQLSVEQIESDLILSEIDYLLAIIERMISYPHSRSQTLVSIKNKLNQANPLL